MMSRTVSPLAAAAALAISAGLAAAPAVGRPLVPAEERYQPYAGQVPACDDPAVLSRIQSTFASKESGYWGEAVGILGFERVRQTALRPWGMDHIPRRFCQGQAILDETPPKAPLPRGERRHPRRTVVYSIVEGGGFAGYGFGVEWCVQTHDHNVAYAPACRAAGP